MNQYLSLKDHVYKFISTKITEGSLVPNEKINEQLICEELNISRTPVREALIQLATEGYLSNIPRKGFKVKPIDEKKATELYLIIGNLEGLAASTSCDLMIEADFETMESLVTNMDYYIHNDMYEDYYQIQSVFHDTYIDKCGNEELIRLLKQLKRSFIRRFYITDKNEDIKEILQRTNDDHKVILQLFRDRNTCELEHFLKNVHWSAHNAKFDSL